VAGDAKDATGVLGGGKRKRKGSDDSGTETSPDAPYRKGHRMSGQHLLTVLAAIQDAAKGGPPTLLLDGLQPPKVCKEKLATATEEHRVFAVLWCHDHWFALTWKGAEPEHVVLFDSAETTRPSTKRTAAAFVTAIFGDDEIELRIGNGTKVKDDQPLCGYGCINDFALYAVCGQIWTGPVLVDVDTIEEPQHAVISFRANRQGWKACACGRGFRNRSELATLCPRCLHRKPDKRQRSPKVKKEGTVTAKKSPEAPTSGPETMASGSSEESAKRDKKKPRIEETIEETKAPVNFADQVKKATGPMTLRPKNRFCTRCQRYTAAGTCISCSNALCGICAGVTRQRCPKCIVTKDLPRGKRGRKKDIARGGEETAMTDGPAPSSAAPLPVGCDVEHEEQQESGGRHTPVALEDSPNAVEGPAPSSECEAEPAPVILFPKKAAKRSREPAAEKSKRLSSFNDSELRTKKCAGCQRTSDSTGKCVRCHAGLCQQCARHRAPKCSKCFAETRKPVIQGSVKVPTETPDEGSRKAAVVDTIMEETRVAKEVAKENPTQDGSKISSSESKARPKPSWAEVARSVASEKPSEVPKASRAAPMSDKGGQSEHSHATPPTPGSKGRVQAKGGCVASETTIQTPTEVTVVKVPEASKAVLLETTLPQPDPAPSHLPAQSKAPILPLDPPGVTAKESVLSWKQILDAIPDAKYVPGQCMDYGFFMAAANMILQTAKGKAPLGFSVFREGESHVDVPNKGQPLQVVLLHLTKPDHYAMFYFKTVGGMPEGEVQICEPLAVLHDHLDAQMKRYLQLAFGERAGLLSFRRARRYTSMHHDVDLSCGWACLNDLCHLAHHGTTGDKIWFTPDQLRDLHTLETMLNAGGPKEKCPRCNEPHNFRKGMLCDVCKLGSHERKAAARVTAAGSTAAVPRVETTQDPPAVSAPKKKVLRKSGSGSDSRGKRNYTQRPSDRRIASIEREIDEYDGGCDSGGPGFRVSPQGLRRTLPNKEVTMSFSDLTLRRLLETPILFLPVIPSIADGISMEQRRRHIYLLDSILDVLLQNRLEMSSLSLPKALVMAVERLASLRKWRAPTALLSSGANLLAAMSRLDQYAPPMESINLNRFSEWRDAMGTWTRLAFQYQPQVTEVTKEQVHQIIPDCTTPSKVLLIISWLHAARVGNVFKLRKENFHFEPQSSGLVAWAITWNAAKTTKKVGPYTTHSSIPKEWYELLQRWLVRRQNHDLLFKPDQEKSLTQELRLQLRLRNPKHDLRSLRRGSLCAMAKEGTPIETLLVFSGHRTVDMLLRYIQRGKMSGDRMEKGARAAKSALH
jgi:Phage integrase family